MASFDENGKYIKTNWKAGDKITATKLNKIEESIEAVNDNDISRHVEADARLDALEAKDVAHDKEFTNVRNLIADNKAVAELGDYEINSRMQFLEQELNEGIEEVHNVADTVDGKIAQGKADMEAMVAEVEADLEGLHAKDEELSGQVADNENNLNTIKDHYLMVNVKDFGAKGDGATDDTQSIIDAKDEAIKSNKTLYFPKGVYCFTDLGNLGVTDFKIEGVGHKEVTLKCISNVQNHKAIRFDAYESGSSNASIILGVKFKNIIVEGNELTQYCIYCQGLARMDWENIYFRNCNNIGLQLNGCHENHFKNVSCGHNYTGASELNLTIGIQFDWGIRGGVTEGRSTNNTSQNCYYENTNEYGINLINGDQNVFISCASQGNEGVGVYIQPDARMTTFIGCGFEKNNGNPDGDADDIVDNGRLTTYNNCYTQKSIKLNGQQIKIISGLYKSIKNNGYFNDVGNVRVNYSGVDEGGFIDNGVGTKIGSICDISLDDDDNFKYVVNLHPRATIQVTSSPFIYTNKSGRMEEVIMQTGNVISVQKVRGSDNPFLCSPLSPNTYILGPTESLIFKWEGEENKPTLSKILYNGY